MTFGTFLVAVGRGATAGDLTAARKQVSRGSEGIFHIFCQNYCAEWGPAVLQMASYKINNIEIYRIVGLAIILLRTLLVDMIDKSNPRAG